MKSYLVGYQPTDTTAGERTDAKQYDDRAAHYSLFDGRRGTR
ncbi:hypothetical protein [Halorussus amylolyticus]|nr:hypothetical protein [Halorussus amylolyticus]